MCLEGSCKDSNEILSATRDRKCRPVPDHFQVSAPFNLCVNIRVLNPKHGGNHKALKSSVVNKLTT